MSKKLAGKKQSAPAQDTKKFINTRLYKATSRIIHFYSLRHGCRNIAEAVALKFADEKSDFAPDKS